MSDKPPQNQEAERALLGCLLIDASNVDLVSLSPADFANATNATIYKTIKAMTERGAVADIVTLKNELKDRRDIDAAYISGLIDGIPEVGNPQRYADIIRDEARKRDAKYLIEDIASGRFTEKAPVVVNRLMDMLGEHGTKSRDMNAVMNTAIKELEARIDSGEWLTGIDTGFKPLNDILLGWQRGIVTLVSARTTVGKTAFLLSSAKAAASLDYKVAYFSPEEAERNIAIRLMASESGVHSKWIRSGKLREDQMTTVFNAALKVKKIGGNLLINDSLDDVNDILAEARLLHAKNGLDLIMVDYAHIIWDREHRTPKREQELGRIASKLQRLAIELNCAVVLASQENREAVDTADGGSLETIGESDKLAQIPRTAIFLSRPFMKNAEAKPCEAWVFIGKNAMGDARIKRQLHYDAQVYRFTDEECIPGVCAFNSEAPRDWKQAAFG